VTAALVDADPAGGQLSSDVLVASLGAADPPIHNCSRSPCARVCIQLNNRALKICERVGIASISAQQLNGASSRAYIGFMEPSVRLLAGFSELSFRSGQHLRPYVIPACSRSRFDLNDFRDGSELLVEGTEMAKESGLDCENSTGVEVPEYKNDRCWVSTCRQLQS